MITVITKDGEPYKAYVNHSDALIVLASLRSEEGKLGHYPDYEVKEIPCS